MFKKFILIFLSILLLTSSFGAIEIKETNKNYEYSFWDTLINLIPTFSISNQKNDMVYTSFDINYNLNSLPYAHDLDDNILYTCGICLTQKNILDKKYTLNNGYGDYPYNYLKIYEILDDGSLSASRKFKLDEQIWMFLNRDYHIEFYVEDYCFVDSKTFDYMHYTLQDECKNSAGNDYNSGYTDMLKKEQDKQIRINNKNQLKQKDYTSKMINEYNKKISEYTNKFNNCIQETSLFFGLVTFDKSEAVLFEENVEIEEAIQLGCSYYTKMIDELKIEKNNFKNVREDQYKVGLSNLENLNKIENNVIEQTQKRLIELEEEMKTPDITFFENQEQVIKLENQSSQILNSADNWLNDLWTKNDNVSLTQVQSLNDFNSEKLQEEKSIFFYIFIGIIILLCIDFIFFKFNFTRLILSKIGIQI